MELIDEPARRARHRKDVSSALIRRSDAMLAGIMMDKVRLNRQEFLVASWRTKKPSFEAFIIARSFHHRDKQLPLRIDDQ